MNKKIKVLIMVICLFAIATTGFVNATPRPLKEANMVYWTSLDPKELPVPGNQISDFKLKLDGNPNTWYYLDIKFIKPVLQEMEDGWFLTPPEDQAFWDYWAAKGVDKNSAPGTWERVMWLIIHGDFIPVKNPNPPPTYVMVFTQFPMFFLMSDGEGNYMLVDGLQFWVSWFQTMGKGPFVYNHLRLNGDYPKATYTFTSDLEIHEPEDFEVEMTIMFR